jgi:hypothetical protein
MLKLIFVVTLILMIHKNVQVYCYANDDYNDIFESDKDVDEIFVQESTEQPITVRTSKVTTTRRGPTAINRATRIPTTTMKATTTESRTWDDKVKLKKLS